jgi:predicted nucleic acid-binding protein
LIPRSDEGGDVNSYVCIITGDQDLLILNLLILKKFGDIDILAPSEFEAYEVKSMPDPPRV